MSLTIIILHIILGVVQAFFAALRRGGFALKSGAIERKDAETLKTRNLQEGREGHEEGIAVPFL
jgi:hypothetical protein